MLMRKLFSLLIILSLLFLAGASGAEAVSPPETPAPARIHIAPEPTPEPPPVLDASRDPSLLDGFRFRLDAQLLHIWFPIIANADEAVIIYGDDVWLIDCGDKGMGLRGVRMMQDIGVTKIDRLFNTHPHPDHLAGLQVTHEAVPVGELLYCFPRDTNESMLDALAYAKTENIPVRAYKDSEVFTMGDGKVSLRFFMNRYDGDLNHINDCSAQTIIEYGSRRILFTADMERAGQEQLLARIDPEEFQADILKYPHHGKSALLEEFYEAVSPSLAIVTNVRVWWNGVNYLEWKQIPYLFTCTSDTYLHLITDGSTWIVERVPMTPEPNPW